MPTRAVLDSYNIGEKLNIGETKASVRRANNASNYCQYGQLMPAIIASMGN